MLKDLKSTRESLGISQIALARRVGVSMLTIRLWEMGAAFPKEENLKRLKLVIDELKKERSGKK